MLFNSIPFVIFFAVLFVLYWGLRRWPRAQNLLLLAASYIFYGWWDMRFLLLITVTTAIAYSGGLTIQKGGMSRAQRIRVSLFIILSAVFFLGLDPRALDLAFPRVVVDWGHLWVAKTGYWWAILGVGLLTAGLNALYPLALRLRAERRERLFLTVSVVAYLGILGFFKYFNFFVGSFQTLAQTLFDVAPRGSLLRIILPVGISFYTFLTISYTVDVYRRKCEATGSLLEMATYVAFFPLLLSGPIERGSHLLGQFQRPRHLGRADLREGLWLVFWGLYKKMVVADHLTLIVKAAFDSFSAGSGAAPVPHDGLRLLITLYAFALQIYCDFSGYTDVARGTARLLGFDIMLNFNLPYAARNPSDFWKRWHISLSSWLRDYLYIPLGGNRHGTFNTYRNLMLTMLLGGLWHGAAWTFVLWGAYHGFLLVIYRVGSAARERGAGAWRMVLNGGLVWGAGALVAPQQAGASVAAVKPVAGQDPRSLWLRAGVAAVQIFIMFHLVCLGWLLFRAPNMTSVGVFLHSITLHPHWSPQATEALQSLVLYGWFVVFFEVIQAWTGSLESFHHWPWFARLNVWLFVILSLLALAAGGGQEFIYFAF
jgi:alginate O-acetyltransferase complex protein AlgI